MPTARVAAYAAAVAFVALLPARAQEATMDVAPTLLVPARVFDAPRGVRHEGGVVLARGARIAAVGPRDTVAVPAGTQTIALTGTTLLPGLIDAHSHLFLHPYAETPWADQVLKEPLAVRVARATVAARRTIEAGFTTLRDLRTEGAYHADVGLKQAIDLGTIPGRRRLAATPATLATAPYGPGGF